MRIATLLGDDAFYGWASGKNHVEAGTTYLASAITHAYKNAVVVAEPVQETGEDWIFTHIVVDLETGVSTPRQWRESKRSIVDGNMDKERKDAIRFGRGQSKNIRNAILHKMPKWLVNKALEEAKKGARDKLEKFIKSQGLAAAQSYTVQQLKRYGVTEEQILEKMGKAEIKGLDVEDLVKLSADFKSIDSGQEHASTLFPTQEAPSRAIDLKDKLKARVDKTPAATPEPVVNASDPQPKTLEGIQVRTGTKPFTWFANDGVGEYLVQQHEGIYTCNCKPKCTDCAHVAATTRVAVQS
jgi:hypothetical protein